VAFVEPGHEAEDVRRHLRAFRDDATPWVAMGHCARAALERAHHPDRYAGAVVAMAELALAHRRDAAVGRLDTRLARISIPGADAPGAVARLFDPSNGLVAAPDGSVDFRRGRVLA
jgi:hypothetical protein